MNCPKELPLALVAFGFGCGARSSLDVFETVPAIAVSSSPAPSDADSPPATTSNTDAAPEASAMPEASAAPEAGEQGLALCPQGCCEAADAAAGNGGAAVVADSVAGFSDKQGQCGWSYGYLPAGAEPFTAITVYTSTQYPTPVWEEAIPHPPWIVTFASAQHPNATPMQWNDRRWTSTGSGAVSIQGHLAKADTGGGDGITAHIRVAGVELWSAPIAYNDTTGVTFNLTADVQLGTTIDFLIAPNTTDLFDTTTLTAVISEH